jgi:hypothetical protein
MSEAPTHAAVPTPTPARPQQTEQRTPQTEQRAQQTERTPETERHAERTAQSQQQQSQPQRTDQREQHPEQRTAQREQHAEQRDVQRTEQQREQRPSSRLEDEWQAVQYEFVDDPKAAVRKADDLVTRAIDELTARHRSLAKQLEGNGDQQTEDLRLALHRYRELFKSLVAAK